MEKYAVPPAVWLWEDVPEWLLGYWDYTNKTLPNFPVNEPKMHQICEYQKLMRDIASLEHHFLPKYMDQLLCLAEKTGVVDVRSIRKHRRPWGLACGNKCMQDRALVASG